MLLLNLVDVLLFEGPRLSIVRFSFGLVELSHAKLLHQSLVSYSGGTCLSPGLVDVMSLGADVGVETHVTKFGVSRDVASLGDLLLETGLDKESGSLDDVLEGGVFWSVVQHDPLLWLVHQLAHGDSGGAKLAVVNDVCVSQSIHIQELEENLLAPTNDLELEGLVESDVIRSRAQSKRRHGGCGRSREVCGAELDIRLSHREVLGRFREHGLANCQLEHSLFRHLAQ